MTAPPFTAVDAAPSDATSKAAALPAPASTAASPAPPAARRRNNFDGLRLLAALLVVFGHQSVGRSADPTGTSGLRLVMFFSISGFLVAGSWAGDPHVGRFLARRFLRLWPAYAVLIVGCAAASWVFPARDMPDISRLASLFYLQNLVAPGFDWGFFPARDPMMNRSLWMLPFEVDFYLAFALLAPIGRTARLAIAALLLIVACPAEQTVIAPGGVLACWSRYFGGFFAFGVLLREVPPLRNGAVVATCVASGVVAMALGFRTTGLLLMIPPGAVWIGLRTWPVLRSAARFGDVSYGVFLWSFPVQQVTRLWLDPGTPLPLQFAVVVLEVVPIAWLSCWLIERPALRWKPRRPLAGSDHGSTPRAAAVARTPGH